MTVPIAGTQVGLHVKSWVIMYFLFPFLVLSRVAENRLRVMLQILIPSTLRRRNNDSEACVASD